jgi:hypothetical protein
MYKSFNFTTLTRAHLTFILKGQDIKFNSLSHFLNSGIIASKDLMSCFLNLYITLSMIKFLLGPYAYCNNKLVNVCKYYSKHFLGEINEINI